MVEREIREDPVLERNAIVWSIGAGAEEEAFRKWMDTPLTKEEIEGLRREVLEGNGPDTRTF